MKLILVPFAFALFGSILVAGDEGTCAATAQERPAKPNIVMLISDDTGYGDLGVYGGGVGRGMATPNLDKLAREGMQFWSFYGQPSCTPGRAAMQTGRIPNRSGMTTVAFQGQGGGLPSAEWTLASVLKKYARYRTYFSGKWHLGESDYSMPTAHGYDIMDNVILYHLNAYTYGWPSWNPDMTPEALQFFADTTIGRLRGVANEEPEKIGDVTEENIAELDMLMTRDALRQMEAYVKDRDAKPFFMSINFGKNHQPNLRSKMKTFPRSTANSAYADCVVELDYNVGRVMDKIYELGIADNTFVIYTVDNGAWQDVHPDSGYTPFRGTKGTVREGGSRVPAIAWWPKQIAPGSHSHDIVGGLDLMATFASMAGIEKLPEVDRAGEPIIFDSVDMSNVLFGGACEPLRKDWYYFTEMELSPGAVRLGKFKAVFNLRGDNGAMAGSDTPGQKLGWRGPEQYIATVPALYDLWQDPQERYDVFMNGVTEKTWAMIFFNSAMANLTQTYEDYPPRPLQSETYTGPMTITRFRAMQKAAAVLEKINDTLSTMPVTLPENL